MALKFLQVFRVKNWWQYKLPPLVAVFFMGAIVTAHISVQSLGWKLGGLFIWMIANAAFGYFLNDWTDIEEDARAGKTNWAPKVPVFLRWVIVLALVALSVTIQAVLNGLLSLPSVLNLFHLFFFIAYSVKPIRFKERFLLGPMCDAFYAHLLPTLIVLCTVLEPQNPLYGRLVLLLAVWQAVEGIRNILLHHVIEREKDMLSGTNNMALRFGVSRLLFYVNYLLAPAEAVLLALLLFSVGPMLLYISAAGFVTVWALRILLRISAGVPWNEFNTENITLLLLNNTYEQLLPVIAIVLYLHLNHTQPLIIAGVIVAYSLLFPAFAIKVVGDILKGLYWTIRRAALFIVSTLYWNSRRWAISFFWWVRNTVVKAFWWVRKTTVAAYWKIVSLYWRIVNFYWKMYRAYWKYQHEKNPKLRYSFCTITTHHHLYKVLALYHSLMKLSSKVHLHVLVTDGVVENPEQYDDNLHFHYLDNLADIKYAKEILEKYADDKDRIRWCMKPILIQHLIKNKMADSVIYLDNDIYFFNDFIFLFDYVSHCGVWLTPHWRCMDPFVDEQVFNDSFTDGMFNAGFIGASGTSGEILEWWAKVCSFKCEKNRPYGYWDDQKYLDMLPVRFPNVGIVRHQGCNVAIWNKRDCNRTKRGDEVYINNQFPVVFIHFTNDTIEDIRNNKYGGDPLLKPHLEEYLQSVEQFKKQLQEVGALSATGA
ncbi:MAG TPA: UbiA family prenyltransferase [Chitinophagales bacterium]|nr:UbiA family prenyltransferase [Chitinophagales bacterium]